MEMSFDQYIANPLGKRNAVFSQREMFRQIYKEKFDKVFLREAGKIDYTMYVDEAKDRYIIHVKVPSETVKNFYYDAVIMFYSNDPAAKSSSTLKDYFVKFFSNDPAFVYTYLRVFLKNGMLFEDLKPKSSKIALEKDPNVTNPYQVPGYSKIIYFAYLFMKQKNLFAKHMYTSYGSKYTSKKLLANVEHTDKVIAERQRLGEEQHKEEIKQKRQEQHNSNKRSIVNTDMVKTTGMTNVVRTTDRSRNINTTRTTRTTRKTPKKK